MRHGKDNKLAKCTQCSDRTANGLAPACSKTCPTGAITYGDRDALIAKARKVGYAKVYGQTDLGGLGTLFAFKDAPKIYGYADKPAINEMVIFWHTFLKPAAKIGMGSMAVLTLLLYMLPPGRRRTRRKKMELNNDDLIRKETSFSIATHWTLAVSCIFLTLSGFAFLFHSEFIGRLFGGFPMMRDIHNFLGILFTVSIVLSLFAWLKESIHWDRNDFSWFLVGGGYLGKLLKGTVPPMHKLNPGQKMFYLTLLACGFGTVRIMIKGTVPVRWARKKSPLWVKEIEEEESQKNHA